MLVSPSRRAPGCVCQQTVPRRGFGPLYSCRRGAWQSHKEEGPSVRCSVREREMALLLKTKLDVLEEILSDPDLDLHQLKISACID